MGQAVEILKRGDVKMYEVVITDMDTEKRQVFKCGIVTCCTVKTAEPFGRLIDGTVKGEKKNNEKRQLKTLPEFCLSDERL